MNTRVLPFVASGGDPCSTGYCFSVHRDCPPVGSNQPDCTNDDNSTQCLDLPPGFCDLIDFNGDGVSPDSLDLDDFLSVFSGGACSNDPDCHDIDFNNDDVFPDSTDQEAFLRVLGGGPCIVP